MIIYQGFYFFELFMTYTVTRFLNNMEGIRQKAIKIGAGDVWVRLNEEVLLLQVVILCQLCHDRRVAFRGECMEICRLVNLAWERSSGMSFGARISMFWVKYIEIQCMGSCVLVLETNMPALQTMEKIQFVSSISYEASVGICDENHRCDLISFRCIWSGSLQASMDSCSPNQLYQSVIDTTVYQLSSQWSCTIITTLLLVDGYQCIVSSFEYVAQNWHPPIHALDTLCNILSRNWSRASHSSHILMANADLGALVFSRLAVHWYPSLSYQIGNQGIAARLSLRYIILEAQGIEGSIIRIREYLPLRAFQHKFRDLFPNGEWFLSLNIPLAKYGIDCGSKSTRSERIEYL